MISKSLIISTNLQKEINKFDDCLLINMLLTELVKNQLRLHCDMYNIDESFITVQYRPISTQLDLTEQYRNPLDEAYLRCIVEPTKHYLTGVMLAKWPMGTGVSCETTVRVRMNFNVMFLSNGTIMLTEEEFEL